MVQKIVINTAYSFFGISDEAIKWLKDNNHKIGTKIEEEETYKNINRDDKSLVKVIEELGVDKASKPAARLKIIEIPEDIEWYIGGNDGGGERVIEKHRVWRG
jgi:hypothetical protein